MRSPVGRTAVGKKTQRNTSQTQLGKGIKLGNVFTSTENHNSSCPNVCTTSRWLERQRKLGLMWTSLRKDVDLEYPTPWLDQVFMGCTQRETEVHQHVVQAKADLFGRITTTQVTSEEQNRSNNFFSINHCMERRYARSCRKMRR